MPIYEYTCSSCKSRFEKLIKSIGTSEVNVPCPECGSTKTARSMSVFAVASTSGRSSPASRDVPGMCGRCGGPGPCSLDD